MAAHHQVIDDLQVSQSNDHGVVIELDSSGNVVIELDAEDDPPDLDQDCVFVRCERNLMSRGTDKQSPICVDEYAKQETNLRRTLKSEKKIPTDVDAISVDDYDNDNDDIGIVTVRPSLTPKSFASRKRKKLFSGPSVTEVGGSSGPKSSIDDIDIDAVEVATDSAPPMFNCEICADIKALHESFKIKGCSHSYCFDCMKNYVASKLQDGVPQINCPVPTCPGLLEPEYCRDILPFEVFDRWGKLLCESVILASQKFYCPFKDCSALLIDDGDVMITQSECPSCFRLFCAQCKVGWHEGIECSEYQKLRKDERDKEDIMLRNLAKQKLWQRCPRCKFYVEKSTGCLYMRCRCGTAFCYNCGAVYPTKHAYHYCNNCGH